MFLNSVFGAGASRTDPEEERDPPPEATPATFPTYDPFSTMAWSASSPPPKLQPLFARIKRPTDITLQHVVSLNINVEPACSPSELLPLSPGTEPPEYAATYADAAKVDAAQSKRQKEYADRLAEVRVDNDTAFRVITKTPKPGVQPPRLAYMRKFWEAMENMSQYWDTSLDQYYDVPPEEATAAPQVAADAAVDEPSSKSPKRQRLDSGTEHNSSNIAPIHPVSLDDPVPTPNQLNTIASPNVPETRTIRSTTTTTTTTSTSTTPEPAPPFHHRRYKGRRTGTGRQMPEQFRVDTVRAFVEGAAWPFQATLAAPRHPPVVQLASLNLPVRQTSAVYRVPLNRAQARQGFVQGPIMGLQARGETGFSGGVDGCGSAADEDYLMGDDAAATTTTTAAATTNATATAAARLDLMRELGELLQLAQERAREGKVEVKPGEGKWWTSKPRWGGGPGGEAEGQDGSSDALQTGEEPGGSSAAMMSTRVGGGSSMFLPPLRMRKKKTPEMLWKELKCGTGFWDSRTEYQAIGKDAASSYDQVFMVSALNHHISILKLTVHTAYTEYLLTGQLPDKMPAEEDWGSPRLQRTVWYDLFDVEQRVQAFEALWAVMAHMTREPQLPSTPEMTHLSVSRT